MKAVGSAGGQFFGAPDCALHAFGVRSARHLGAERAHDRDFFFGKIFGHKEPNLVSAIDSDQGKTDAGVSGSGFDDGAAWPQFPVLFCRRMMPTGGAIFHAAARIEVFQLGEHVG